jgi:hypothetical protein
MRSPRYASGPEKHRHRSLSRDDRAASLQGRVIAYPTGFKALFHPPGHTHDIYLRRRRECKICLKNRNAALGDKASLSFRLQSRQRFSVGAEWRDLIDYGTYLEEPPLQSEPKPTGSFDSTSPDKLPLSLILVGTCRGIKETSGEE